MFVSHLPGNASKALLITRNNQKKCENEAKRPTSANSTHKLNIERDKQPLGMATSSSSILTGGHVQTVKTFLKKKKKKTLSQKWPLFYRQTGQRARSTKNSHINQAPLSPPSRREPFKTIFNDLINYCSE